jgi:O-acetyl-ADP-ribose deacetylase (regulator of RNase III)
MECLDQETWMNVYPVGNTRIVLKRADITQEETEAIVNAANSRLQHGGGVAGAIVRRGGRVIQEESDRIGYVPVGGAALTSGGSLKARFVIHAVGPRMGEGDEDRKLKDATLSSLHLADQKGIRSLSFPAISTGIFGYPIDRCACVMLEATREHCGKETAIREIRFCLFDDAALQVFAAAADAILRTTKG